MRQNVRPGSAAAPLDDGWSSERARLVRFCAHLSGSADAAEDLAQETLIEAWRHAGDLRDPAARDAWLAGIARNVCRRSARARHRDAMRLAALSSQSLGEAEAAGASESDVEREELAELLDRALAELPAVSRDLLIQRYVESRPHAEIGERLGLSEGAVMVRVHRAKRALRRALAQPPLRREAASYGLLPPEPDDWRETRIWCPFCGRHKLVTRLDAAEHGVYYRCPAECVPNGAIVGGAPLPPGAESLTSAKSILTRTLLQLERHYQGSIAERGARCIHCGRPVALAAWQRERASCAVGFEHGIRLSCRTCNVDDHASLWHLALDTAAAQRFWRRHPRLRVLPAQEIDAGGRPAFLTGFVSLGTAARLDLVLARDSYRLIAVDGDPAP